MNTKKRKQNKVLIVAGGTGGHIYPALAVAERLTQAGCVVEWIGSQTGIEKTIVPACSFVRFHSINMPRIRGKGILRWLFMPYILFFFVWKSFMLLGKIQPNNMLAMGGFVTMPVALAAWARNIPLFIHEQNAVAGMSNRVLSLFAQKVFTGFPNTTKLFKKSLWIGNPVRMHLQQHAPTTEAIKTRFMQRQDALRIVILGGSQGASAINQLLPPICADLCKTQPLQIRHQTGKHGLACTQAAYTQLSLEAHVCDFVENIAQWYCWADLVISRAGAMTISEMMTLGVGAVLIPFPAAVDDHQMRNADFMQQAGAAKVIVQKHVAQDLPSILRTWLAGEASHARQGLLQKAQAARSLAPKQSHQTAAAYLSDFLR